MQAQDKKKKKETPRQSHQMLALVSECQCIPTPGYHKATTLASYKLQKRVIPGTLTGPTRPAGRQADEGRREVTASPPWALRLPGAKLAAPQTIQPILTTHPPA